MAGEVFISYAREDAPFVRQLYNELQSYNRSIWVDWEDIPLTADWWAAVQRGIEAADAFVFVITPASAESEACFREIEHARLHKKRIVPILHRDPNGAGQALHPAINAHNWIFIRENDDFRTSVSTLIEAMDTDLDYVREHTRLLVRARSWEMSQHDSSQLLRDNELRQAEAWLAQGLTKDERDQPSDLHTEYIKRSRQASNLRLVRNIALAAVVALILGLFIVALILGREAQQQRDIAQDERQAAELARLDAEEQGEVSQAIGLAAQAQLELFGAFPERGVLLALEALETLPYVWQADRALGAAVQVSRARSMFQGHTDQVQAVAWSPDGTRVASASDDETAIVWDAAGGNQLITLSGHIEAVVSVAWSPDNRYVVTGSRDNTAKIWDVATGTPLETLFGHADWVTDVAWSPDGTTVATASADGSVGLWDMAALVASDESSYAGGVSIPRGLAGSAASPPVMLVGHSGSVNALDWKSDSSALVTVGNDDTIRVWDAATGSKLLQFGDHIGGISVVDWSPDGTLIVSGGRDDTVKVWDAATGTLKFTLTQHIGDVTGVMVSPNDSLIATTSRDRTIRAWDVVTGALVFVTSGHTDDVTGLDWSPDSTRIVTSSDDHTARSWNAGAGDELFTLTGHTGRVTGAAWSPDGTRVVTSSTDQTVRLWTLVDEPVSVVLSGHEKVVSDVAWSPDGLQIATVDTSGVVRFWNGETGAAEGELVAGTSSLRSIAWSPDSAVVVTAAANSAIGWDVASGSQIFQLNHDKITRAEFAPDGIRVVTAGVTTDANTEIGTIKIWAVPTQTELLAIVAYAEAVNAVAWSPDGTRIASGGDDGFARIWDAATGEELAVLAGHTHSVVGVSWSPDSQRVITASLDHTARVWSAVSGNELLVIDGHAAELSSVAWSPTGERAVTTGGDAIAKIWRMWQTHEELVVFARECCVFRELNADERIQFNLSPVE